MKNNYIIENNHLKTEAFDVEFGFSVKTVIYYDEIFVVMLDIPTGVYEMNNIYGVDKAGRILWRIEDSKIKFPIKRSTKVDYLETPIYVGMNQDTDGSFFGITFWAMKYTFDYKTGKLLDKKWMRW